MHSPCLFVVVPVAVAFVLSATGSSASPTSMHKKHHAPKHNRTRMSTIAQATNSTRRTRVKHVISPRSVDVLDVFLGDLMTDHDGILAASHDFSRTAKKARSHPADDGAYHQEAVTGLTAYRHSIDPLQSLFAPLATDKGLANYDKSDKYETLIKDIVNASKYTLSDVDDAIDADPLLGPLLGPIMYEIKCILDELLDATENLTDASLNWLAPLLEPLILSSTKTVCRSIIPPIAGLCL